MFRSLSFAALVLGASCSRATPPAAAPERRADARLDRVTLEVYRGSSRSVSATADQVQWLREDGRFQAQNVVAHFPSKDGDVVMTAPKAEGALSGQAVEAQGGVKLASPSGLVATSPRALYDAQGPSPTVSSDAGVEASAQGAQLEARAFSFDVATQRTTFLDVRTRAGGRP